MFLPPITIFDYAALEKTLEKYTPLGKWMWRLGNIKKVYATPCSTTPMLWVNAAWVSAPRLIYLYTKPFIEAEEAYRFLNTRCGKAKDKRGAVRRLKAALNIQGPDVPPELPTGTPAWAAFEIAANFALKSLWYAMIADRVSEFIYNFTSLPYEWEGCPLDKSPYAEDQIPTNQLVLTGSGSTVIWAPQGDHVFEADVGGCFAPPKFSANAFWSVATRPDAGGQPPRTFEAYLWDGSNNAQLSERFQSKTDENGHQRVTSAYLYDGSPRLSGQLFQVKLFYTSIGSVDSAGCYLQLYGHRVGAKGLMYDP